MLPAADAAILAATGSAFNAPLVLAAMLLAALAAVWLCAVAAVWHRQEQLIFHPDARPLGELPAALAAARFRAARVSTADGLELCFWAAPPLPGWPTLVMFHGRAGNAADRAPLLAPFAEVGYGVVLAEYRGYGGNPGAPSEAGFLLDARAHLDWVAAAWGETAPVVCGESIGSGVAVAVATERPVRALVLDAPYTSIADLASAMYRWLPARRLLRHRFDSLSRLPAVRAPMLVLHGEADDLISTRARTAGGGGGGRASGVRAAAGRGPSGAQGRSGGTRNGGGAALPRRPLGAGGVTGRRPG